MEAESMLRSAAAIQGEPIDHLFAVTAFSGKRETFRQKGPEGGTTNFQNRF